MRRILYVGLEVPPDLYDKNVIHCPLIKIVPRPLSDATINQAFADFKAYTHVIFTSKTAVAIFMDFAKTLKLDLNNKTYIAVGKKTAAKMKQHGIHTSAVAEQEMAEGIIDVLKEMDLSTAYVFWPHSALSRPVISDWLEEQQVAHCCVPIYDTVANIPEQLPKLDTIDEIMFTSPSTVDAFVTAYGAIPADKQITCIGPVTQEYCSLQIGG